MTIGRTTRRDGWRAIRATLESAGFLVLDPSDGERGSMRLGALWADLIRLDLPMPRMGGLAVRRPPGTVAGSPLVVLAPRHRLAEAQAAMRPARAEPLAPESVRRVLGTVILRMVSQEPVPSGVLVAVERALPDLIRARRALGRRAFAEADRRLRRVLDRDPDSAAARTLMGLLRERTGEPHAAYREFKAALGADPRYGPALDRMQRYCTRYGLDARNVAINPGAVG
jgi:hypothetical protein